MYEDVGKSNGRIETLNPTKFGGYFIATKIERLKRTPSVSSQ
jgi:hypothetical protein